MPELYLLVSISFCSFIVFFAILKESNLLSLILLNGVFSLLTALMYLVLDAPDVAMTESVVSVLGGLFAFAIVKNKFSESIELNERFNPFLFCLAVILALVLIYASADLPQFGEPGFSFVHLQYTKEDIGISSVVTAILASYRGYDTLLETLVILVAGMSVLLINNSFSQKLDFEKEFLVQSMSRMILPLILLFALYLQFHGEISPGGGFQAGVLVASGFALYCMSYNRWISIEILKNIAVLGVLLYLFIGVLGVLNKSELFNYNSLSSNKLLGQQIGIMLVELGVGITVSATLLMIFLSLTNASNKS